MTRHSGGAKLVPPLTIKSVPSLFPSHFCLAFVPQWPQNAIVGFGGQHHPTAPILRAIRPTTCNHIGTASHG